MYNWYIIASRSLSVSVDLDRYVSDLVDAKVVHEIHTSERKSFRACRRRWDWLFRQNYYPITTAKPLEFGTAYHAAMEVFYDPEMWSWDREVVANLAAQKFLEVCATQKQAALDNMGDVALGDEVETDYQERVELGIGMLKYAFADIYINEDMPKGWKPLKVEIAFMVPIPNPETGEKYIFCKCEQCWQKSLKVELFEMREDWIGLPVVYAGRCDMLAEDRNGNYWIFDWKTAAQLSVSKEEYLDLDDQIASYVWALRWLGLPIKGFVYAEQRKAFPQPPAMNKVRRQGRLFSVNKQQATDYESYLQALINEDAQAYADGLYDEFLEYLKENSPPFYHRYQRTKTDAEVRQTEINIGLEALDIIDSKLRIYPSPGRFGCGFCAFRQPCLEANAEGDPQTLLDELFVQREAYYVRQEASTESKGGE